jgi:hypothetical protein
MAGTPARNGNSEAGNTDSSRKTVELMGWRSPQGSDGEGGIMEIREGVSGKYKLRDEAVLASWATPTSRDHKDGACNLENNPVNSLLGRQVLQTDSGEMPNGSSAATESTGQYRLSVRFSLWLMAIPPDEWVCCAERATRSMQKRRKRSSKA